MKLLTVGTHTLTCDYSGDANYNGSTRSISVLVTKAVANVSMFGSPQSPTTAGQSVTFSALVSAFLGITPGSVTLRDGTVDVATVALNAIAPAGTLNRASATISVQPAWGYHSYTLRYNGSADLDPATSTVTNYTVNAGAFGTPIEVRATATGTTSVDVVWSPLSGATSYDLYRHTDGASDAFIGNFTLAHMTDNAVAPVTTYLYYVIAHDTNGALSAASAADWATTVSFTDDPIVAGTTQVSAQHILQLRTAINAMRAAAGLDPSSWARDPVGAFVRATDIDEVRSALAQARSAFGASITFVDPSLEQGVTPIRAVHIQQLRDAVK